MPEALDEAFSRCEKLEAESKAVNRELLELVTALDFELPGELVEDSAPRVYKPLARSARLRGGSVMKPKDLAKKGAIPVHGAGKIIGYADWACDTKEAVVIGRMGTIGKPRYATGDFNLSESVRAVVSRNENKNLTKFFYYWLRTVDFTPEILGAVIPGLPNYRTNNLPYPQIPIEEQRRIISVLDKQRAFSEPLAPLLRSLADNLEEYLEQNIRKLIHVTDTEDFRVYKPFARAARLQGGKDPQGIFDDSGKNLVYASGNIAGRTNEKTFDAGRAVIFSKTGTIGKPRYTEKEFWHTGNTTAVFSRNENRNLTKFFYYWMRSFDYTDYVVGSVIQTLPSYRINNLPYPQIPIEEQRRIVETLDKQRALTEAVAPRLRALADLSEQRVSSLIDECVDGTRVV